MDIEAKILEIRERLDRADQSKNALGNMLISESYIIDIIEDINNRLEHIEDVLQMISERGK